MANDHDKFTCGCSDCNDSYYYANKRETKDNEKETREKVNTNKTTRKPIIKKVEVNMLKLTHANTGNVATVFKNKIFGYTFSGEMKCMIILSESGAVFPVKETEEELNTIFTNPTGGEAND